MLKFIKSARIAGLATALCVGASVTAASGALTITTGSDTGTYRKFGENIALIMQGTGIDIEVAGSQGSVENLKRLLGYVGASEDEFFQLGIVQADVLEQLRAQASGDPVLESIVGRLKVVLPLYGEEIHVFVPEDIETSDFPAAVREAFDVLGGKPQSGTRRTVQSIFDILGLDEEDATLKWQGGTQALDTMRAGFAGMMIDVSGAPSTLAREDISADDGLRLMQLDLPELVDRPNSPYRKAVIPASAYPWLDGAVETIAVESLLVAYAYDETTAHCENIKVMTRTIVENIDRLREIGHRKWLDFRREAARQRSDLYECARAGLYGE